MQSQTIQSKQANADMTKSSTGADHLTKRRVLIVRIVQPLPALPGYEDKATAYWDAARSHAISQESTIGPFKQIFIEGVMGHGTDGMLALQQANPGLHRFVKGFADTGAALAPFEDSDLLQETADWSECLNVQPRSDKVRQILLDNYTQAAETRNAHLNATLNSSIGLGEAAIILTISEHLPLPSDIERYLISPPELDQLNRWLREQLALAQQEMMRAAQEQGTGPSGQQHPDSGSQLWTPP